jgi:hypothetical protein
MGSIQGAKGRKIPREGRPKNCPAALTRNSKANKREKSKMNSAIKSVSISGKYSQ